ncbi:MAG: glycosyltransferase family 4 protein [Candidatus Fermentibacteraceae bacterium]|nr:glycosyltransferase family 4 protein [Candidatus Fermentibacteraceae bacterium]
MESTKVCMVVKNQLWNDARVKKEAISLTEAGFNVTIIARTEEGCPTEETWKNIRILRPPKDSARREVLRKKVIGASAKKNNSLKSRIIRLLRRNRFRRFLTDLKRDIPWEYRLYRAALSTGADIFHANDLDTLFICAKVAGKLGARLVYDSHELWLESSRYFIATSALNRLRYRITEKILTPRTDAVIAVTPSRGEVMKKLYPSIRKLVIIENSTDPIEKLQESSYLRNRLGIPVSVPVILYQGIICPERGLDKLLEAASILRNEDIAIVIMGHDAWQGKLHRMHSEMNLKDSVFLLPPVPSETLPEVTVSADVGLILFENTCLNHYYSLPNKLYEYMMAGLPIIASDFPEMARIINNHNCGILVDSTDAEAIASGIRVLVNSPDEMRQMGIRGRKASLDKYNWPVEEKKLVDLYMGLSV